jgi:hypothetical protein
LALYSLGDYLDEMERMRVYGELLVEGSVPLTRCKLLVCGDPEAGKTTLVRSIQGKPMHQRAKSARSRPNSAHLLSATLQSNAVLDRTRGVDISTFTADEWGEWSVWDFAGQADYHISHNLFLAAEAAVFLVVVDLREDEAGVIAQLRYWLRFIRAQVRRTGKADVVLVGGHADEAHQCHRIRGSSRSLDALAAAISLQFGRWLRVASTFVYLDCRQLHSNGMSDLVAALHSRREALLAEHRKFPRICEAVLQAIRTKKEHEQHYRHGQALDEAEAEAEAEADNSELDDDLQPSDQNANAEDEQWQVMFDRRDGGHRDSDDDDDDAKQDDHVLVVIMQWSDFVRTVRRHVGILYQLTNERLLLAARFLHFIGEIIFDESSVLGNVVVFNPQWVCSELFGWMMAPELILQAHRQAAWSQFKSTSALGSIATAAIADLGVFESIGLEEALSLLKYFEVAYHLPESNSYVIPALLAVNPPQLDQAMQTALSFRIACESDLDMITPGVFPQLQVRSARAESSASIQLWQHGLRVTHLQGASGLMCSCFLLSEDASAITIQVLRQESADNAPPSKDERELLIAALAQVRGVFHRMCPGSRFSCTLTSGVVDPLILRQHEAEYSLSRKDAEATIGARLGTSDAGEMLQFVQAVFPDLLWEEHAGPGSEEVLLN